MDTILDKISNTGIFQSHGSLAIDKQSYITRDTDQQLYDSICEGNFSYVVAPRETGKSSLRIRTMDKLQNAGYVCSSISITSLGNINISPEQWYYSYLFQICRGLGLTSRLKNWWRDETDSTPVTRVVEFFKTVVLEDIKEHVVIFIDEIEAVQVLDKSIFNVEEYFASICSFYNLRVENPDFNRLNFVMLGSAAPQELVKQDENSPFNIGKGFALENFKIEQADPLLSGFEYFDIDRRALLREVFYWTSGQPLLTQHLCEEIAKNEDSITDIKGTVANYANKLYLNKDITIESDPHLSGIQNRVIRNTDYNTKMLGVYQEVYNKQSITADVADMTQQYLILSGLMRVANGEVLVNNQIYREKFDQNWIGLQLKKFDRPFAADLVRWLALNKAKSAALKGEVLRGALVWASERDDLSTLEKKYLDFSRRVEKEEEARKRRLLLLLLILSGALLVGAVYAALYAMQQRADAIKQTNVAVKEKKRADDQKNVAIKEKKRADDQRKIAENNLAELEKAKKQLEEAIKEATRQKDYAKAAELRARLSAIESEKQKRKAVAAANEAKRLSLLSKAQSLAFKATLKYDDPQVNGLLAMQGYKFNKDNGGLSYDPNIYEGLRAALGKIDKTTNDGITLDADPLSNFVFGDQKTIIGLSLSSEMVLYDMTQKKVVGKRHVKNATTSPVDRSFIFAKEGTAVIGYQDGKVFFDKVATDQNVATPMKGFTNSIRCAALSPDGKLLATGARDNYIRIWDVSGAMEDKSKYQVKLKGSVRNVVFTTDGKQVITADESGMVCRSDYINKTIDTIVHQVGKRAISLAVDSKQERLGVGYSNGLVEVYDLTTLQLVTQINNAGEVPIELLTIDPTSKMMAIGTAAGIIKIYRLDDLAQQPITIGDIGKKLQLLIFNPDGRIFALLRDNQIRNWETSSDVLASKICEKLNRNLTKEEWKREIGDAIPYVETCKIDKPAL